MTNNTYEYYGAEFYQPDNHGTSHLSIIGENGDAIAVTSTINL
jgi:gamma-glutamyltranspeptidase / glutathione hydrolase / leukotriene-C4 hydrolase